VPTSSSTNSNQNTDQSSSTNNRARLGHGAKSHETTQKAAHVHRLKERGHNQVMTDIYVNLVGEMMYPKTTYGLYGYAPEDGRVSLFRFASHFLLYKYVYQFPIEKVNTLGYLLNPLRKRSVIGTLRFLSKKLYIYVLFPYSSFVSLQNCFRKMEPV
jgi:hypothetical protein